MRRLSSTSKKQPPPPSPAPPKAKRRPSLSVAAKAGSLLYKERIGVARAADEENDEEDEVVVVHATCNEWQVGLAGAQAPDTWDELEAWESALDRAKATEIMREFLLKRYGPDKPCAPNLLVVVEAEQLQHDGATRLREVMLSSSPRASSPRPRTASDAQLAPVLSGVETWVRWAKDEVGFQNVVLIDSRHASLFEHKQLTSLEVNVTRDDGASILAVCHGFAVAEGAASWGSASGEDERCDALGAALAKVAARVPTDARRELASKIYVSGSLVDAALGSDRERAARRVDAAVTAAIFGDAQTPAEVKVMLPAARRYSSWIGASAMCLLDATKRAWTPAGLATLRPVDRRRFFDATAQAPTDGQSYWTSMLGAFHAADEDDLRSVDVALPAASIDRDDEEMRRELRGLNSTSDPTPDLDFLRAPRPSGPLWLWDLPPRLAPRSGDRPALPTRKSACRAVDDAPSAPKEDMLADADAGPKNLVHRRETPARRDSAVVVVEASASTCDEKTETTLADKIYAHRDDREAVLKAVDDLAAGRLFSCAQIYALIERTPSIKTRVAIVERLGPRATDPEHGAAIVDGFKYDTDKVAVKTIFADAARLKSMGKRFASPSKPARMPARGRAGPGRGGRPGRRGGRRSASAPPGGALPTEPAPPPTKPAKPPTKPAKPPLAPAKPLPAPAKPQPDAVVDVKNSETPPPPPSQSRSPPTNPIKTANGRVTTSKYEPQRRSSTTHNPLAARKPKNGKLSDAKNGRTKDVVNETIKEDEEQALPVPPVTKKAPPVALTKEVPPVAFTKEVPPIALTKEVPPIEEPLDETAQIDEPPEHPPSRLPPAQQPIPNGSIGIVSPQVIVGGRRFSRQSSNVFAKTPKVRSKSQPVVESHSHTPKRVSSRVDNPLAGPHIVSSATAKTTARPARGAAAAKVASLLKEHEDEQQAVGARTTAQKRGVVQEGAHAPKRSSRVTANPMRSPQPKSLATPTRALSPHARRFLAASMPRAKAFTPRLPRRSSSQPPPRGDYDDYDETSVEEGVFLPSSFDDAEIPYEPMPPPGYEPPPESSPRDDDLSPASIRDASLSDVQPVALIDDLRDSAKKLKQELDEARIDEQSPQPQRRVQFDVDPNSFDELLDPQVQQLIESRVAARVEAELETQRALHEAEITALQKRHIGMLYLIDKESYKLQNEYAEARRHIHHLTQLLSEERAALAVAREEIDYLRSTGATGRAEPEAVAIAREFESCVFASSFGLLLERL
ncbi:hypothetical protein CTAYLR_005073 [Chrysophaeum taylorii]|uniref:DUF4476 domain-containing protein n=1 Tax=Chrysophaeum taylorii TaxID=2483200 RepID=A0AAD7XGV2_9STRA|nr:hypothetical protein CTAYLR_005073 [Chrysophaeum taylorii]